MVNIVVKWGKKSFDVCLEKDSSVDLLKAQLFELTNVPLERQKLIVRGKQIKSQEDLSKVGEGMKIMMMGSAEEIPKAPENKVVFEEDLSDAQKAVLVHSVIPPGLKNLGNTCYMNSGLQCLKAIPELKEPLKNFHKDPSNLVSSRGYFASALVSTLGGLMAEMDSSVQPVTPFSFISTLKTTFPQFGEVSNEGVPMQQDAEEALGQLLHAIGDTPGLQDGSKNLFHGQFLSTLSCQENKEEVPETKIEDFMKLRCHITQEVNHLTEGLRSGLLEEIEKISPTLQRNAVYQKAFAISKLPEYLNIQFVRFFWRKEIQKKTKILRKVTFPLRLDVLEFCTDELKSQISSYRDRIDSEFESGHIPVDGSTHANNFLESGIYELFGVVTHKGRAANSGHYIGWTKDSKSGDWFKFDDDVVTKVKEDDITALSGGGDWHTAYILFYRAAPWRKK